MFLKKVPCAPGCSQLTLWETSQVLRVQECVVTTSGLCGAEDGTQGRMHTRQVLTELHPSPVSASVSAWLPRQVCWHTPAIAALRRTYSEFNHSLSM